MGRSLYVYGLVACALSSVGQGAEFRIDSALSFVTVSGTVNEMLPVLEQSPGSLTGHFHGVTHIELTETTIEFLGGHTIIGIDQAGPFQPLGAPAVLAGMARRSFLAASLATKRFAMC